jgi:hypothetical protein
MCACVCYLAGCCTANREETSPTKRGGMLRSESKLASESTLANERGGGCGGIRSRSATSPTYSAISYRVCECVVCVRV